MQRGSTRIGKFSWGSLARAGFCALGLVLAGGEFRSSFAQPGTIKATIKVCVVDEQDKAVNVVPTLFNSPARINLKDGDCYKVVGARLDLKQLYFVAAAKEDRTTIAFAPLIVNQEDDGKEKVILLKLERHTGPATPAIEICLSSETGAPLSIREIKQSSDSNILKEENRPREGCSRVSVASANEYKLALTVGGTTITGPQQSNRLLNIALLFLAVASCGLTGFVLFRLNQQRPLNTTTLETVESISNTVAELKRQTKQILDRSPQVCSFKPPATFLEEEQQTRRPKNETGSGGRQGEARKQLATSRPATRPSANTPATIIDQDERSLGDAKQRYRSFSQGQSVEHFFVMPSGASSASSMVEDAGVELREQNSGTYVAFHAIDNPNGAWAFPMPGTHFTSESFRSLFPNLTAEQYEIGDIEPRALVLLEPKLWKLSS